MKKLYSIFNINIAICTMAYLIIGTSAMAQLANWSAVLPNTFPTNVSGQIHGLTRVSQMKFHPSLATKRYAISARGGLFISTNSGANWAVAPGCDIMPTMRLASVCIDHTNDQILYLGTGDHNYYYNGNGVYKSTNGGTTFTYIGLAGKMVVDMIMDPLDNQKIVAITNTGIYKTINAGSTWVLKTASFAGDDIKQKSPNSRVLYATSNATEFYRSTDFGETWSQITNGIVLPAGITTGAGCRVAITPADTNIVYLGMVANGGMIYKSTDGGTTFSAIKTAASPYLTYYDNLSTSSGQGDYNFGIGVDKTNSNILYLVAHNNWKSVDGGVTWTQLTNWWQKCHTDMHEIVTNPYNNNELYNMNDGGVFLSTDGGNNWTPQSDGMNGYEIYHGNCSPTRRDMISIGTQDNGELYSTTTGWFTNRGGDWGSQCAFDYRANSSMVYYFQNNKRRLVTGGDATYGLPARVANVDDIAFHRSNPSLAFLGDSFIYRTTNLTVTTPTWTQIGSTGKIIKAMHSAFDNANVLYVITNDGNIMVSQNALSATPTFTTYVLPNSTNTRASITTIAAVPGTVYITANTKAYKSTDYGATWTNITYNLPSVNHVRILADEYFSANQLVFVASNNTVYYKTVNATTWTIFNTNLPSRTEAIDLSIFNDGTANTSLRYASYGRSMWETPITNLRALNAGFIADNLNPCTGVTVQFSDLSTGAVTGRTWSFPGGTPSTSTATNPTVVYNTTGTFNVSLTVTDGVTNSTFTQNNYISTTGANLPMSENFEGALDPPNGWLNLDNSTQSVKWNKTTTASSFGLGTSSMMFDNYSWNNIGEKDEIQTQRVDLSTITGAKLYFDVAYQAYSGYNDTLNVLVSTNCGTTFTNVYSKGGTGLSTAGSGTASFVPTAAQWRTDTINLTAYAGQSNVLIRFQNRNGYGNKLYLDNVNIIQVAGCTTPLVGGSITGTTSMSSGVASTFTLTGNTGNSIQWQTSSNGGSSWNNVIGANGATLNLTLSGGNYLLRAVSSLSTSNCAEAYSNNLTLNVTFPVGDVLTNPIIVSSLPYSQSISNATTFSSTYIGSNAQSSADIFYRFTTGPCTDSIKLSTCGSGFDTYVHLLNATGNNLSSNDDNGVYCTGTAGSLKFVATPNTVYYAVFEGYGSATGTILANIEEIDNPIQTVTVSASGPTTFCQGDNVILSASSPTGILWSNNATTQNITVSTAGNYSATLTSPSGCVSSSNTIAVVVNICTITLNLKAFLQGYYLGSSQMTPTLLNQGVGSNPLLCDTVTVELHNTTSPFALAYSFKGVIGTNGTLACTFPGSASGNTYYLVVKHRNSIETWSANAILISSNTNYDFSNDMSQAYGNNMVDVYNEGIYSLYSGDINQDGSIDLLDYPSWENDFYSSSFGFYSSDLNGDGSVDLLDYPFWENNFYQSVFFAAP